MGTYKDVEPIIERLKYEMKAESKAWTDYDKSMIDVGLRVAMGIIREQPTADVVEVKHGEWLMCLSDEPWKKGYHGRCSECGAIYTYNINKMPKRCDNCDAKMSVTDINVGGK